MLLRECPDLSRYCKHETMFDFVNQGLWCWWKSPWHVEYIGYNGPTSGIHPFSFGGIGVLVATTSMRDIFKYGPCGFTYNFRLGRWISVIPKWLNMVLSFWRLVCHRAHGLNNCKLLLCHLLG